MYYFKNSAIEYLNHHLSLPASGTEQDWDIELSNGKRLSEFLDFMEGGGFDDDIQYAIMGLTIASYDVYLDDDIDEELRLWNRIKAKLDENPLTYKDLIEYWGEPGVTDPAEFWNVTPLMRTIKF